MSEAERTEIRLRIEKALRDLRVVVDRELGCILRDLARLQKDEPK